VNKEDLYSKFWNFFYERYNFNYDVAYETISDLKILNLYCISFILANPKPIVYIKTDNYILFSFYRKDLEEYFSMDFYVLEKVEPYIHNSICPPKE
jgi:hypothetical protein